MSRRIAQVAVVLTAIEPEYVAARAHLRSPTQQVWSKGTLFDVGTFQGGDREWQIALAQTGPSGEAAGTHVERAIAQFGPSIAIFVGTAGGLRDVALGDVVAATDVYGYDSGNDTASGPLPRVKTRASAYGLVQLAQMVSRERRCEPRPTRPHSGSS
jgi:nucleoside phosphorylase